MRITRRAKVERQARGATYASRMYSGGGESQVIFSGGGRRYIVYDSIVRTAFGPDGNDAETTTGLVIQRAGRTVSKALCTPATLAGTLSPSKGSLPAGRFVER